MHCQLEELCRKEVICVQNASRLGFISDVVVDTENGCVVSVCVVSDRGGFFRPQTIKICWNDILKIGEETVLVKEMPPQPAPQPRRKRLFGR